MLDQLLFGQKTAPDFFWDARGGVLPPGASFARASTGWSFNSAGTLASAGTNVARFDYDPATLLPLGYLAEMQSTNNNVWSSDLTKWTAGGGATVATDGTLGPDGTTAMYKVTSTAGNAAHWIARGSAVACTVGQVFGVSAFVKQGNQRYVTIGDFNDTANHLATFDFQAAIWSGSLNAATEAPRQLTNGIWRLGLQVTAIAASYTPLMGISFGPSSNPATAQNYVAVGTETGYVTGGQIESAGVGVTSYIPTAGSAVTRAQDILSLPLSSLPRWNAAVGGVLVAKYRLHTNVTSSGNGQPIAFFSTGVVSPYLEMMAQSGGAAGNTMYDSMRLGSGTYAFQLSGGTAVGTFILRKQAFGWGPARGQHAYDGTLQMVNTGSFAVPNTMSTLSIGNESSASLDGTIESIAFYAGARSDAFVQQVSR